MSKSKHPPQPSKLNSPITQIYRRSFSAAVSLLIKNAVAANKKKSPKLFSFGLFGGDRGDRTRDLTDVNRAL